MQSFCYHYDVSLSDQLRESVKASGKLPSEVATGAGIALSVLTRFLAGQTEMRSGNLDRLATFLQLELRPKAKRRKGGS
jgi:hypothetical protein